MEIGQHGEFGPNVQQHVAQMAWENETELAQTLHHCMEVMIVMTQLMETWKQKLAILKLFAQVSFLAMAPLDYIF